MVFARVATSLRQVRGVDGADPIQKPHLVGETQPGVCCLGPSLLWVGGL